METAIPYHRPAAVRQIAFKVYLYYTIGFIVSAIYLYFVVPRIWNSFNISGYLEGFRFFLIAGFYFYLAGYILFGNPISVFRIRHFSGGFFTSEVYAFLYPVYEIIRYFFSNSGISPIGYLLSLGVIFAILVTSFLDKKNITTRRTSSKISILIFFIYQTFHDDINFWKCFWIVMPVVLIMSIPSLMFTVKEYVKETQLYRRIFIHNKGGETARWGGIGEILKMDINGFFQNTPDKVNKKYPSTIYFGHTYFENDVRVGGRPIGSQSEQHMITVAGTGAGKSRDVIWNTLLSYNGGIICFDPKGEHVRLTYRHRYLYGKRRLVDPFRIVEDIAYSDYWNPLDEIDPKSSMAREQITNLASASLFMDKAESANSAHFRDNARNILRGFIAHVMTYYPEEKRHLGTVYDLIKTGDPDGNTYSLKATERLWVEMATNRAVNGAPRDAASLLQNSEPKERSAYMSTIARGIDWINTEDVRKVITKKSTFSVRDAKKNGDTIYLVMPEYFANKLSRFIATFFSLALDMSDEHITPHTNERRTLMLFDEFSILGHFEPAAHKFTKIRSSYIKMWIILQNIGQLDANYSNISDFTGSSDMQFFGISNTDDRTLEFIANAIGNYTERYGDKESHYSLLSKSGIAEFLDAGGSGQIVIPYKGNPLKLRRVPYFKNYAKTQYGERHF